MCSVIGVYSKSGNNREEFFELLSSLKHRGSEGFGVSSPKETLHSKKLNSLEVPSSKFLLGHSLLSTTGFAFQPIEKGKVKISHNGQIYNYGFFSGNFSSDSECIADFFSRELEKSSIISAVKKFMHGAIGEYSVGLLFNKRIFAFRDPIGVKPLWFGENDNLMAFASEPKALLKLDIYPLPLKPGHLLELSGNGMKVIEIFSAKHFCANFNSLSLKGEFEKTIEFQTKNIDRAAVLFSGGVDSSLIAKACSEKIDVSLFVAGTEGSSDFFHAGKSADSLGLQLKKIELNEENVPSLALRCSRSLTFFDEMQLGIGIPELACSDAIKENNFKVVFSGQGSDELFCGYSNYAKILEKGSFNDVEKEIWHSISRMWLRNFHRDDSLLALNSLELRVPFCLQNFVASAMKIPAKKKILSKGDKIRKHPIRELAALYGLPREICQKPKKAMQYGSGSQKLISKFFNS